MQIDFVVPGPPRPKGRPRFSRQGGRAYTPAKTREAEDDFFAVAVAHAPEEPWAGPVYLSADFHVPVPSSWPAWRRDAALIGFVRPTSKPDLDNLLKLVKDAMSGVFWKDDAQVVRVFANAAYSSKPQTQVKVAFVEQPTSAQEYREKWQTASA